MLWFNFPCLFLKFYDEYDLYRPMVTYADFIQVVIYDIVLAIILHFIIYTAFNETSNK